MLSAEALSASLPPDAQKAITRHILRICRQNAHIPYIPSHILPILHEHLTPIYAILLDFETPTFEREPLEALATLLVQKMKARLPVILEQLQIALVEDLLPYVEAANQTRFLRHALHVMAAFTRHFDEARAELILHEQASIQDAIFRSRLEIEKRLRESEERYRTLVELLPDAIILHHEGTILYANPATYRLLGIPKEVNLVGESIYTSLSPDYRELVAERVRAVQEEGLLAPPILEVLYRMDGSEVFVEVAAAPALFQGKRVVLVVARDVSERVIIERQLAESRARLAQIQEQERLQLAQELHDDAIQALLAITYELSDLRQAVKETTPELVERLTSLRSQVRQVIESLRRYVRELRPPGLRELGLVPSMEGYLSRLREQAEERGIRITTHLEPPRRPIPGIVELCFYRIMQEAVRNALQHANPSRIEVRLWFDEQNGYLLVSDDGQGFEKPKQWSALVEGNHFGLVGMVERVASVNGHIEIDTQPGGGTRIHVHVPLVQVEPRLYSLALDKKELEPSPQVGEEENDGANHPSSPGR